MQIRRVISGLSPKFAQGTVERWLKQLKDKKKIEFIGSQKTGGYYVK